MSRLLHTHVESAIPGQLSRLLGRPPDSIERQVPLNSQGSRADLVLRADPHVFLIECKGSGDTASVGGALRQLERYRTATSEPVVPLVGVPFMGETGAGLCREAGVGWIDLSGNAHIEAPGLLIHVEGKPNRFKGPGRPSTVFAPKSSRIARLLLLQPRSWRQEQLAAESGLGSGYVSKIVRRLEEDALIRRHDDGTVQIADPNLLLDAWSEAYDFGKHRIFRGHVSARFGTDLARRLDEALTAQLGDDPGDARFAATGLTAAWQYDHFAAFRTATFYLRELPSPDLFEQLGFREQQRGANVWLVVPNDEGVFHGAARVDGVLCVSAVQTYLDLSGHPERAQEAAESLRTNLLTWSNDG